MYMCVYMDYMGGGEPTTVPVAVQLLAIIMI